MNDSVGESVQAREAQQETRNNECLPYSNAPISLSPLRMYLLFFHSLLIFSYHFSRTR